MVACMAWPQSGGTVPWSEDMHLMVECGACVDNAAEVRICACVRVCVCVCASVRVPAHTRHSPRPTSTPPPHVTHTPRARPLQDATPTTTGGCVSASGSQHHLLPVHLQPRPMVPPLERLSLLGVGRAPPPAAAPPPHHNHSSQLLDHPVLRAAIQRGLAAPSAGGGAAPTVTAAKVSGPATSSPQHAVVSWAAVAAKAAPARSQTAPKVPRYEDQLRFFLSLTNTH
jgi:hypothetical protein